MHKSKRINKHIRSVPLITLLLLLATATAPVQAANPSPAPSSSPSSNSSPAPVSTPNPLALTQAQTQLQQTEGAASQANSALLAAQQNLTNVQVQLNQLQNQVDTDNLEVSKDQQQANIINQELLADQNLLINYLRTAYENGSDSNMNYILGSPDFSSMFDRINQIGQLNDAASQLVKKVHDEQSKAKKLLADAKNKQQQALITTAQEQTVQALIVEQEQKLQLAANVANSAVNDSQANLANLAQVMQDYQNAVAALQAAKNDGQIYPPVVSANFTTSTDLTSSSSLTADQINTFLQGTALQGLGPSYIAAQNTYHVNARYLVAHSIEESDWGTSAIAQYKNNLFGFGADDANPYQDADTYTSFTDCINQVAQFIHDQYLIPSGSYYHGPTLLGMNVDYASDPNWAANIARIANTIPPSSPI